MDLSFLVSTVLAGNGDILVCDMFLQHFVSTEHHLSSSIAADHVNPFMSTE